LYHAFNTRYNIYFNGNEAFKEAYKTQLESFSTAENYAEPLLFHPVSAMPKENKSAGGAFDKPIEKSVKAIKYHSIQTRPERGNSKSRTPEYKEFMKRKEYNPFLHNAWTMMAQSQFFNGDFLEAASTFSYISNLYVSQTEIAIPAKLWKARCYNEMGWYYDADNIISKINRAQLTRKQYNLYSTVYADYLLKQKLYEEAVPYLQTAIQAEKNKIQHNREKYMLGQIYIRLNQKPLAYKTFGEVAGSNVPYILQLNARIRQTEVFTGGDTRKISKQLKSMAKNSKNKEYLDLVYYALGNVYITIPDTAKAVESYELGVEKSTRGGIDKAINQIKLGDIYFEQRKYVKAQPNYSEALGQLKKDDAAYPRVSKRSKVLDALVIHAEAVELQDSLQRLSRMTEEERLQVVEKIIADLKKKEKEEKEKAEMEEYQVRRQDLQAQRQTPSKQKPIPTVAPLSNGLFYFYDLQAVATGKNTFQQKWGRRKLEDNWRRRNKKKAFKDVSKSDENTVSSDSLLILQDSIGTLPQDSIFAGKDNTKLSEDPHDPQFYLQQIPTTEEEIEESNLIIQDGMYNMGIIYKDMLEDYPLAIETLDTLNIRFPKNENKLEAYHHIYLIYWKLGDMAMANIYKNKIRSEFPHSELAIAMADTNYEYNQKIMSIVQDSLYQNTFKAYEEGNIKEVRRNYNEFSTKYTDSRLMPKFMFVHTLTYARPAETDTFKVLLKQLINKYPNEDVSLLATNIMMGFQRGLLLASSGDNMLARGSIFNLRFGALNDSIDTDTTLVFSIETHTPYRLLLLYPKGSVNENLLLFNVAGFNFSNFAVNDFDLTLNETGNIGMLQIDGFDSQEQVLQYYSMITGEDGYAGQLEEAVIIVPVSITNYEILMKGKSLEDYMDFFDENFGAENGDIVAKWRLKQDAEQASDKDEQNDLQENVQIDIVEPDETSEKSDSIISLDLPPLPVVKNDSATVSRDSIPDDATDAILEDTYNNISEKTDALNVKLNEISENPVKGILGLFKRKSKNAIDEYAAKQEKIEKEQKKQLQKELREKQKQELIQQLLEEQEQERQENAKQDSVNTVKKQKKALAKATKKAKKQAIKNKKREKKAILKAKKKAKKKK
jgi:tetratricopeptide (TPR) repeat protein